MIIMSRLAWVELKLFLREPSAVAFTVGMPAGLLMAFGSIPSMRAPNERFGGLSFIDVWMPSLTLITLVVLALQALPITLGTYRERGILRRMSTTPMHPGMVLAAQLVVYVLAAVVSIGLLIAIGRVAFGVPVPRHLTGFVAASVLGAAALFALGLVIAAVGSTGRAAGGIGMLVFQITMFTGGVYVPRFLLPDLLARIGEFLPPGVGALQDAWTGTGPQPLHLAVMAVIAVAAGTVAARIFRWE
jgi:ABC-2 type transport system permease protein